MTDTDLDNLFEQVFQVVAINRNSTGLSTGTCSNLIALYKEHFKEGALSNETINQINNILTGGKVKIAVYCSLPKQVDENDVVKPPTCEFDVNTRQIVPPTVDDENSISYFPNKENQPDVKDTAPLQWRMSSSKINYPDGDLWCCIGEFNMDDGTLVDWDTPFKIADEDVLTKSVQYSYEGLNLDFRLMFNSYLAYKVLAIK